MASDVDTFFRLYAHLPREGPGEASDVAWAGEVAGVGPRAQIADVACGSGGDIAALLDLAPKGHVTAIDRAAPLVVRARARRGDDPRVTVLQASMARIANRYDFIWCAGAVYFLGVTEALTAWRKALRPGGAIAFSEPVWFSDARPEAARALFADYPAMADEVTLRDRIDTAGYRILAQQSLSDAAWESYYAPMEARIAELRPQADAALVAVLDEAEAEIACWRAHRRDFGYTLSVVRPA